MSRTDTTSIDIVGDHDKTSGAIDKIRIEAMTEEFGRARHITLSNDEARLVRTLLREHLQKLTSTTPQGRPKPSRLTNFATVATGGVSSGLLVAAFMPTRPILAIIVCVVMWIVVKRALPWLNSFD